MQAEHAPEPPAPARYWLGGQCIAAGSPGFTDAIALAHAEHQRPRCLCRADLRGAAAPEMYVARLGSTYLVKRMPHTGNQHAPHCPSYEPPAESSGLGQVLGSAICEDPDTGETALKLGFSMSKRGGRSVMPAAGEPGDSVASDGTKLSLRGLLHYLWDQAELTRWQPGFAGRRNWATVRRHLLQAAAHKSAGGTALLDRLYIPEMFSVDQRDTIQARRLAHWAQAIAQPGKAQPLLLLIAEVKEIVPARYGYKAVVKHVPEQGFALDEALYRRLGRRFEAELALWAATDRVHMVMVATFSVSAAGVPGIGELSLMPVTAQWLPVEDGFEQQLVERLVHEERGFIKGLRYNLAAKSALANATLTDCRGSAPVLCIVHAGNDEAAPGHETGGPSPPAWMWRPSGEPMPPFPPAGTQSIA